MNKEKAVVSFSGGKDCTLAMYKMLQKGYEISALLVTFDEGESCFHKIPKSILYDMSKAMDIPLVLVNCEQGMDYEKQFEEALIQLKNNGINTCIFGDIDIESYRQWGEDRCKAAGIKAEFPLWQCNREDIVKEFIDNKFKAIIKKVNLNLLSEKFLGKELTIDIINDIKSMGADPCGENGEYHTVVIDGPIFKEKIELNQQGIEILGQFGYLKINNK